MVEIKLLVHLLEHSSPQLLIHPHILFLKVLLTDSQPILVRQVQ